MEIDLPGYNVYRNDKPDGEYVLLNRSVIAAKTPGSTSGNSYTFEDPTVKRNIQYTFRVVPVNSQNAEVGFGQTDGTYYLTFLSTIIK